MHQLRASLLQHSEESRTETQAVGYKDIVGPQSYS